MTTKPRIIIADDDRDLLNLASITLRSAGYDVIGASDGKTALQLVQEHKPDLVLLDIIMPGMTGFDVLIAIREDSELSNTPVVMFTASVKETEEVRAIEIGANYLLRKPFRPAELRNIISKYINA